MEFEIINELKIKNLNMVVLSKDGDIIDNQKLTFDNEKISVGFKVCSLLFVNTIAGILMLCANEDEQN